MCGREARIHLVLGPVGAGKSTYAIALASDERALRLTLDDWMARLFRPDRPPSDVVPWYVERARRCVDQIWVVAREALSLGTAVVLEIGLLRRDERNAFRARVAVDEPGAELVMHALDADRDVRRTRVAERNQTRGATFSMEVPPAIFELASDLWEPISDDEARGCDVRFVRTDEG
jgi:predicted kinase